MKKNGFTLTEVLLSLTIVGIIASITAPILINSMANKDKIQTIKYQKLISEINADLLNNRTVYPEGQWDKSSLEDIPEYGILLRDKDLEKWNILQKNKYAYLLMEKLEILSVDETSNNEAIFSTADGYQWKITNSSTGIPNAIVIDTNGSENEPNKFGSSSFKSPDKFAFLINENTGNAECDLNTDPITCRYLNCPFYMNNKKHDYECMKSYSGSCKCN